MEQVTVRHNETQGHRPVCVNVFVSVCVVCICQLVEQIQTHPQLFSTHAYSHPKSPIYSMAAVARFAVLLGEIARDFGTRTCGFEANFGQPEYGTSAVSHALRGTLQRRLFPSMTQSFPLMRTAVWYIRSQDVLIISCKGPVFCGQCLAEGVPTHPSAHHTHDAKHCASYQQRRVHTRGRRLKK